MSEIQPYLISWGYEELIPSKTPEIDIKNGADIVVKYADHLAALEALKPVPMDMRQLAQELHLRLFSEDTLNDWRTTEIEGFLNEHFSGIVEKKDA